MLLIFPTKLEYLRKQRMNIKSFTETKLEGVDDAITNVLQSVYFVHEQEVGTTNMIIYQDKMRASTLETNGKYLTTIKPSTSRQNIFVTDKVADGDVKIMHISTVKMWTDINTKTKQGLPFETDKWHIWIVW